VAGHGVVEAVTTQLSVDVGANKPADLVWMITSLDIDFTLTVVRRSLPRFVPCLRCHQ